MLLHDSVAWAALTLAMALGVCSQRAAAQDGGTSVLETRPAPARAGNDTRVGVGPRGGITVNGDQWIAGGYGRIDGFCVGACSRNLGIELQLLAGFGGNHMTLRASVRFEYVIWFLDEMFGIYPILGWSFLGYAPIGKFAGFCYRVDLRGCGGWDTGLEVGGGFRVWRFSLGIVAGVGGIPIATIAIGYNIKVWGASK